jgi:flagellin
MQILNNTSAFTVWKSYTRNVTNMRNSLSKLSSGVRIESAGDDPAGLAQSERMRAQYRNSAAASRNIENAVSYYQTADSWLQKIHDILGRMAELSIAANDETKSTTDRNNLQEEFGQMQQELRRITDGSSAAAKFNGEALFHGGTAISLQVGPDTGQIFTGTSICLTSGNEFTVGVIGGSTVTWASLAATNGISIANASNAGVNVGKINLGIDYISEKRAVIGAQQSRMTHTLEGLRNYEDNMRSAESSIRDVDVARETTMFSKYQVLTQVGTSMLAQANAMPGSVLNLVQG